MESLMYHLFGIFLIICGGWFIKHARETKNKARRARDWSKAEGEVVSSKVEKRPGAKQIYRAKIKYTYAAGGKEYSNDAISLGGELNSSRKVAEARCEKYPAGSKPQIYYNPADPPESFLENTPEGLIAEMAGGIISILLGLLLLTGILPA